MNSNWRTITGSLSPARSVTIEAKFNPETGNLAFRADFPNPDRLLRHGQTGTVWIMRTLKNAVVIPQRATFELLDKRYVWVLDKDDVAHQTLITIKHELEDIFVIDRGIGVGDKIVLEGVREVEENAKVKYEFLKPEDALNNQKFRGNSDHDANTSRLHPGTFPQKPADPRICASRENGSLFGKWTAKTLS